MRLYIADEQKLTKFDLPQEVQESFLVPYKPSNSKKEYTINIEANEDKWFLKSNGLVNIIQNESIALEAPLSYYSFYQLEITSDKSQKYLYCLPKYNEKFLDVNIFNVPNITIGNAANCNIYYQHQRVIGQHILIQNTNNRWLLTANGSEVFVNGTIAKQIYLKTGDVIFLNGLRIIFMNNFLRLNNPNDSITINGLQYYNDLAQTDYTSYEKVNTGEIGYELYDSSQYFYHIPRIINGYDEKEVVIDAPPEEEKESIRMDIRTEAVKKLSKEYYKGLASALLDGKIKDLETVFYLMRLWELDSCGHLNFTNKQEYEHAKDFIIWQDNIEKGLIKAISNSSNMSYDELMNQYDNYHMSLEVNGNVINNADFSNLPKEKQEYINASYEKYSVTYFSRISTMVNYINNSKSKGTTIKN